MDLTLWAQLVGFIILLGLSAFFSSSETSLFSLDRTQLAQMKRDMNPKAGLIERLLSEPRRLIVTILIGNEMVNVAASAISAAVVIGAVFLIGLLSGSYWALAIPVALGVLFVLGLAFWVGWTIATIDVEPEAAGEDAEAPEAPPESR